MKPVFSSRRVVVGLALILGINSQLNSRHLGWVGKVPNAIVRTLADPPASMMRRAAVGVQGEPAPATHVPEDQDAAEMRAWIARAELLNRQLWEENRDLRRLLDAVVVASEARGSETIQLLEARIADANPSASNPTLELDKGSRSGVEPGNPVVRNANLLGFIADDIGTLRSSARLVTAPQSRYRVRFVQLGGAVSPESETQYVYVDPSGTYFFCDLRKDGHGIQTGDLASMADDLYPQAYGYLLGEVEDIREHPDDPTKQVRVIIRMPIDPAQLREVLIQVRE